jgi:hypothetical protein
MEYRKNLAGETFPRNETGNSEAESQQHSWSNCDSEHFHLRSGQNYLKNQEKAPSPPSLMDLVGADIVRCQSRIDHIASSLQLHPEWLDHVITPDIPSLFIINVQVSSGDILNASIILLLQIPEDFSTSFFSSVDNGQGWSLVLYFKLTEVSFPLCFDINL